MCLILALPVKKPPPLKTAFWWLMCRTKTLGLAGGNTRFCRGPLMAPYGGLDKCLAVQSPMKFRGQVLFLPRAVF
jgi:hypothetical protein